MSGEKNLKKLIQDMEPILHEGTYVFVSVASLDMVPRSATIFEFKEDEGITLVVKKETADALKLSYEFEASWITLNIHSSLEAVGLTAAFSGELAKHKLSCNVVAGFYHDHLFVARTDAEETIRVLKDFSKNY